MLLPDARSSACADLKHIIDAVCRGINTSLTALRASLEACLSVAGLLVYVAIILVIIAMAACWEIVSGLQTRRESCTRFQADDPVLLARSRGLFSDDESRRRHQFAKITPEIGLPTNLCRHLARSGPSLLAAFLRTSLDAST